MPDFENVLCFRAFTELYINVDKKFYRPCCYFNKNAQYNGMIDFHETIRSDNLKNQWSSGCGHCKNAEELNSISHRLEYVHSPDTQIISENKFVLKHLELRLDTVCNLACITCDSGSSSKWVSEDARMFNKKAKPVEKEEDYSWLFDDELWKNVETLVIYGGEPLYSKKLEKILFWLDEKKLSKNITLNFYTNGTVFNTAILDKLNEFKLINLQFSIDGIGENFEIIRWPAKWEDVVSNITKVKQINNINISINYLVSVLNIFNVQNDYYYLRNNLTENVSFNFLERPDYYNIKHLPEKFKKELSIQLIKDPIFNEVVKKINRSGNSEVLKECFDRLKTLDRFRNTYNHGLFPENFVNFLLDNQP